MRKMQRERMKTSWKVERVLLATLMAACMIPRTHFPTIA